MPCFRRKKIPPMWFLLDAPKASGNVPSRQGPYTRTTIVQMVAHGQIAQTKLVWTNERIFPNAKKPKSKRLVRIREWRRLDQFPDPVLRKLQAEARAFSAKMDSSVTPPPAAFPPDASLNAYSAHAPQPPSYQAQPGAYPAAPPQGPPYGQPPPSGPQQGYPAQPYPPQQSPPPSQPYPPPPHQ